MGPRLSLGEVREKREKIMKGVVSEGGDSWRCPQGSPSVD